MEIKKRILQGADELFMKYGIRSVTMDDIARHLGMSKKTLYKSFKNKAHIVHAVTNAHFDLEIQKCDEIHAVAKDPIEEMLLLIKWMASSFKEMSPKLIYEIKKYYPRAWKSFATFKTDFILKVVKENMAAGIKAGIYRAELNPDIIAKLRVEQFELVFDHTIFPPDTYNPGEVIVQFSDFFLHGLVTIEGKKRIYQYLNKETDETTRHS